MSEPLAMSDRLRTMVRRHEGMRTKPYVDTRGKITIAIGRNLTDQGVSEAEVAFLFENDLSCCYAELIRAFDWFAGLDVVRQDVLVDMRFNLGLPRLLKFSHFLAAMAVLDWETAAQEMLKSVWATQVGARATELAAMIRTGQYADAPPSDA